MTPGARQGKPNILFVLVDQMQGRALDPAHFCETPNLDRLASRGVRFPRAYTTCPSCSPARASLMTALFPHNHGVLWNLGSVADDIGALRRDKIHWAEKLRASGYLTAYVGHWHVESETGPGSFGWSVNRDTSTEAYKALAEASRLANGEGGMIVSGYQDRPPGYKSSLYYGVTGTPPEARPVGVVCGLAEEFIEQASGFEGPWCCFLSVSEPHDPYVAGEEAFARYDPDEIPLPESVDDDLRGRPALYRKAARAWEHLTRRQRREIAACYFASITEVDARLGRLFDRLEAGGLLEKTVVVLAGDHGELMGAHGLYSKNVTAAEEVYGIPLIVSAPGAAWGGVSQARIGIHDLGPTVLELAGAEPLPGADGRSFAKLLADPSSTDASGDLAYAEYHGSRFMLTQRVLWVGRWKYVFNGFDEDEMYDLDEDPHELTNLAPEPNHAGLVRSMMADLWTTARSTGDSSLLASHHPGVRFAPYGPLIDRLEAGSPGTREARPSGGL